MTPFTNVHPLIPCGHFPTLRAAQTSRSASAISGCCCCFCTVSNLRVSSSVESALGAPAAGEGQGEGSFLVGLIAGLLAPRDLEGFAGIGLLV